MLDPDAKQQAMEVFSLLNYSIKSNLILLGGELDPGEMDPGYILDIINYNERKKLV